MLNPITLCEMCVSVLVASLQIRKPASLFATCVDFMSWNGKDRFPCSLLLPHSMDTSTQVMELRRINPTTTRVHISDLCQVILYDNIKVNSVVCDYLFEQAHTRKYQVVVNKLSTNVIKQWERPRRESWMDIDLYSGLEDVGNTFSEESCFPSEPTATISSQITSQYSLRTHKEIQHGSG